MGCPVSSAASRSSLQLRTSASRSSPAWRRASKTPRPRRNASSASSSVGPSGATTRPKSASTSTRNTRGTYTSRGNSPGSTRSDAGRVPLFSRLDIPGLGGIISGREWCSWGPVFVEEIQAERLSERGRYSTSHPVEGRRMALVRHVVPALIAGLCWATHLGAQDSTGAITGRVVDGTTQQAVSNVEVSIVGTPHRMFTRTDGGFTLSGIPAGVHRLRATRIGSGPLLQDVTVTAGATATVQLTLVPAASILEAVVVTGYGTQRREAITGSVSTIDAGAANVGVISNVNQMVQGRAAGVDITQNNGEPGAGAQILIRGGTSISATNAPLYVIDGVPINNVPTEAAGYGVGGTPPLPRSSLNLINPADIGPITILKDASATAIYGRRAANGVVLIETKRGGATGGMAM